jgi:hypothetical protein
MKTDTGSIGQERNIMMPPQDQPLYNIREEQSLIIHHGQFH